MEAVTISCTIMFLLIQLRKHIWNPYCLLDHEGDCGQTSLSFGEIQSFEEEKWIFFFYNCSNLKPSTP